MSERRRVFGEKFVDLGNFTIVALIFGQLSTERKDIIIIILGIILALTFWLIGYLLLKSKRRKSS